MYGLIAPIHMFFSFFGLVYNDNNNYCNLSGKFGGVVFVCGICFRSDIVTGRGIIAQPPLTNENWNKRPDDGYSATRVASRGVYDFSVIRIVSIHNLFVKKKKEKIWELWMELVGN